MGAALLWPLALSLIFGNLLATLVMYAIAFVVDCAVFVIWLRRALGYSKRAARGETFTIAGPVEDRSAPLKR